MDIKFEHFLLTQGNIFMRWSKCIPGRKLRKPIPGEIPSDEWFEHRLSLFDKYCYPSIAGQTNQNFKWMVLFDGNHTNKNLLTKYSRMIPIYVYDRDYEKLTMYQLFSNKIKEYLNPETEWIITSKIDCDDALSKNYVKIMQEKFTPDEHMINPVNGVIYNTANKKLTALDYKWPPNPYITVIEKVTEDHLKTCFKIVHWKMQGPFKKYEHIKNPDPFWLQIIHDKNLSNTFRGTVVRNIDQVLDNFCIRR